MDPAGAIADGKWFEVTEHTQVTLTATLTLGEETKDVELQVTGKSVDLNAAEAETCIETVDGHDIGNSYTDTTFTGVGNSAFKVGHSRNEDTSGIDGTGIMLRRASDSYIEITLTNGLSAFSFDYRKAFTGGSDRQLEISINGVVVETTAVFGSGSGADETVHSVSLTDLTYTGEVVIKIKNVGTTTSNRQTTVDNISWTTNPTA